MMKPFEAARRYAAGGLAVFPVPPGTKKSHKCEKHSGAKWGMTRDVEEIRRDFTQWPDAGVGIPTGAVNGIVVVETDTKTGGHAHDGELALQELETRHGPLPETLQAESPSGSVHRYFRHPGNGIKIRTSASEIGAGIDVRGDGGMVVAPPSVRHDGTYRWRNRNPIAPMPPWLIELTKNKPPLSISQRAAVKGPIEVSNAYAAAALRSEIDALADIAPGSRNHALNRAAFSLHQLVAGGLLDGGEVERRLVDASIANGLIGDDGLPSIIATIRSGARAGLQHPRGRP
jgi:putative DNA primase/helicase